jgi:hypothetical protein
MAYEVVIVSMVVIGRFVVAVGQAVVIDDEVAEKVVVIEKFVVENQIQLVIEGVVAVMAEIRPWMLRGVGP